MNEAVAHARRMAAVIRDGEPCLRDNSGAETELSADPNATRYWPNVTRHRAGDQISRRQVRDLLRHLYALSAGLPMAVRKPSDAGAAQQRCYPVHQQRLSTVAPAEHRSVTIMGSTTGEDMNAQMAQPSVNDRPEQEKARQGQAKQASQQVQQSPTSSADQLGQHAAPGRRPLFRT